MDFSQFSWEDTRGYGDTGVVAMTTKPTADGIYYGAIAMWLDGGANDKHYLACLAAVTADDFDISDYYQKENHDDWTKAFDALGSITDSNIVAGYDFGFYATQEEATKKVFSTIGLPY